MTSHQTRSNNLPAFTLVRKRRRLFEEDEIEMDDARPEKLQKMSRKLENRLLKIEVEQKIPKTDYKFKIEKLSTEKRLKLGIENEEQGQLVPSTKEKFNSNHSQENKTSSWDQMIINC